MSHRRSNANRGPSTSGSTHPPPSAAPSTPYHLPQDTSRPPQPWRTQRSRREELVDPRETTLPDHRILSEPFAFDYQLPSPVTTSRQSISSSSTYNSHQPDHGTWRDSLFMAPYTPTPTQMDYRTVFSQRPDPELQSFRDGGRIANPGYQEHEDISDFPENTTASEHVALNQRYRAPGAGIPLGFERLLHPSSPRSHAYPPPSESSPRAPASRYRLHIRQQPVAARACAAAERDRRPIDPAPILQMLVVDFDPDSEDDISLLKDPRFIVSCLLYSVEHRPHSSSRTSSAAHFSDEGWQEQLVHSTHVVENSAVRNNDNVSRQPHLRSIQVLSGRAHASPFYVNKDPDAATAPGYPSSTTERTDRGRSPASMMPATFFIFTDLSVRITGVYRLQFRLVNWGHFEDTSTSQPILAEVWSDPFQVYSSKDFPGMQKSSYLTGKLRELGVKDLKARKGKEKRKGKDRERDESDDSE